MATGKEYPILLARVLNTTELTLLLTSVLLSLQLVMGSYLLWKLGRVMELLSYLTTAVG